MNFKITTDDHQRLNELNFTEHLFGSRLFGTNSENSDFDYIRIYAEKYLILNHIYPTYIHFSGKLPTKEEIHELSNNLGEHNDLLKRAKELREEANNLYENRKLHNYWAKETSDELLNNMLMANNIREFKYQKNT